MGRATPTWKLYETQIFDALRRKARDAVVVPGARLPGLYSGVPRQVDVLVTGTFPGLDEPQHMVVECKAFSRRVDVKDVEMAFGLVQDVGAPFGLLVTTEGYSQAAKSRTTAGA
jgi:Restriction endonuclease